MYEVFRKAHEDIYNFIFRTNVHQRHIILYSEPMCNRDVALSATIFGKHGWEFKSGNISAIDFLEKKHCKQILLGQILSIEYYRKDKILSLFQELLL